MRTDKKLENLFDKMMKAECEAAKAKTKAEIKRDRLFAAILQRIKKE